MIVLDNIPHLTTVNVNFIVCEQTIILLTEYTDAVLNTSNSYCGNVQEFKSGSTDIVIYKIDLPALNYFVKVCIKMLSLLTHYR